MELHRGGDDGHGGVRFDLSPCPTVSAGAGALSGTASWWIEDDGVAETFASRRAPDVVHSFDEPAPTVQRFGIGDERPGSIVFDDDGRPASEADPGKPPYRVPLLPEIRSVEPCGLTVMSTFSGCGGSCLGFEWAGYRPLLAVEFVPAAAETYRLNHPGVPVYTDDIRSLTAQKAMKLMGVRKGELDVLEGSPPCESFSSAGKLSDGWGQVRDYSDGKKQVMDDLFFEFTRLLGGIKPRAFVAENVSGLARGVSKGYFKRIHAELKAQGYRVEARMLDAQWLGVPQRRQRVIFVGVREDVGLDPVFPTPLPYRYSIRDALRGLSRVESVSSRDGHEFTRQEIDPDGPVTTILKNGAGLQRYEVIDRVVYENGGDGGAARTGRDEEDLDAPVRAITNAGGSAHGHFKVERGLGEVIGVEVEGGWPWKRGSVDEPVATITKGGYGAGGTHLVERARHVEEGQPLKNDYPDRWAELAPGEADPEHHDLIRTDPDQPSPTVTRIGGASNRSAVTHPDDPRKFSIPELRRLCGFPDDFALTGSYAQQWERLGNSVPPPMMHAVAVALRDRLLAG